MAEKDWEDFGWQGLRLRVPSDWNLGRVDGDAEKGYARLDDAEIVRAEIEWRKLKGREVGVPLSDLVDRYLEGLKKKADKAGAGFEVQRRARFLREKQWLDGYDYEVFTWDADFRAFNIALRFVSTQRVVLLRVLAQRDEDQIDVVERIFRSLREEADREEYLWCVYGLRFFMPAEFALVGHELKSGHIQLRFQQGRKECRVHRLSMARLLLKGSDVEQWYPAFFKKQLRDFVIDITREEVEGHVGLRLAGRPRSRWRQLLRPLPFVNPRPRLFMDARIWHRQDQDKISVVEYLYRKKDDASDIVETVVHGHFIEEAEVKPGGDDVVPTDEE